MILMIITAIISVFAIILIPKRLTWLEMYTTSLFACLFATMVDVYLDVKLNLYGFFQPGTDWAYIPILLIIYPAFNIIFLNFFPYEKPRKHKIAYIFGFSVACGTFEYIATFIGTFYHNDWKLWHSLLIYPVIFLILVLHLYFYRWLKNRNK